MVQAHVDAAEVPEPAIRAWGPSLWQGVVHSLFLQRFTAKYFSQLDVEFESLCPHDYKYKVAAEVDELREREA